MGKIAQDVDLAPCEGDFVRTLHAGEILGVDLDVAYVQCSRLILANLGAPQDCFDSQNQLLHRKRLRHIVVGTEFQAMDNLFIRGLGCQHDDGLVAVYRSYPIADLITVHAWQHDVEQDQVERTGQRLLESLRPRRSTIDFVTVEHEHVDETRADSLLVFHHQYAHLPVHQILRLALRRGSSSDSM